MATKRGKIVWLTLLVSGLLCSSPPLFGLVPVFEQAVFIPSEYPDFSLDRFTHGELGVLQPTYARPYLYVAYRYLVGIEFDPEEQSATLAFLHERLECPESVLQSVEETISGDIQRFGAGSEEITRSVRELEEHCANCFQGKIISTAQKNLIGLVSLGQGPEERLRELAKMVLKRNTGEVLKQDLWNYTMLLDRFAHRGFDAIPEAIRRDDVTDWLFTFPAKGESAQEHSLQKWRETSSLPWLIASLSKIGVEHPKLPELFDAAGKVQMDSLAYPSVAFHSIRLLMHSGKKEEARRKLDVLLSPGGLPLLPSARNLFLALRMKVARDLDEFLKYAPRRPVSLGYTEEGMNGELPPTPDNDKRLQALAGGRVFLDVDAVKVLNERMPLRLIKEAAQRGGLPVHLRRELALAAWVRSVLVHDDTTGRELAPMLGNLQPELKQDLIAYRSAPTSEARQFAAIFIILKFPGMRPYVNTGIGRLTPLNQIDNYRDNWWGRFDPQATCEPWSNLNPYTSMKGPEISEPLRLLYPNATPDFPDFLDKAQQATAKAEWNKLASIEAAPTYLSRQVIAWAKRAPHDPRVPEALHRAVKSTRFGCTTRETLQFSKQAFQLLHKRYLKSHWATKTKYWY